MTSYVALGPDVIDEDWSISAPSLAWRLVRVRARTAANPCTLVPPPRSTKKELSSLTAEQALHLLGVARAKQHRLERLLHEANLPALRFHELRHSAAVILISMGVNPKVVQERLQRIAKESSR